MFSRQQDFCVRIACVYPTPLRQEGDHMALHLGMPFGIIAFLLAVPAWATGNVCTWYAPASPCPSNGQM